MHHKGGINVNLHLLSHKYVLNYNSIILKRIDDSFIHSFIHSTSTTKKMLVESNKIVVKILKDEQWSFLDINTQKYLVIEHK